jgi:hypothetical protein
MMNKQKLPHFITVVSFVVFIVLGIACATNPSSLKSSNPSSSASTSKNTGNVLFETKKLTYSGVQAQQMYIGIRAKDEFYLLGISTSTVSEIKLAMDASKNAAEINTELQGAYNRKMKKGFPGFVAKDIYFVSEGDFVLVIDDKEFSLKSDYQKQEDVVFAKSATISSEALKAIAGCSNFQIGYKTDGRFVKELEISGNGLASVKSFIFMVSNFYIQG